MPSVFGSAAIPFTGCVALLAAEVLTILSFASPYWASVGDYSYGLWRIARCDPGQSGPDRQDCAHWDFPWYGDDWQHATRGLESLAIIFFAVPLIVLPVYIYVALGLYYRCILGFMTFSALLGTLANIAGVVVYGVQIGSHDDWKLDWCLIVCVIGGALGVIGTIILLIATINKPEFQPEKYFSSGFYVDQDKNRLYVVETDEPVKVIYAPSEAPPSVRGPIYAPSEAPPSIRGPIYAPSEAPPSVRGPIYAPSEAPPSVRGPPPPVSTGEINPAMEPED